MCDITVDTRVVSVSTVGAWGRGDVIFPKRGILGISSSGLESKQPLMPCQSACFEWFPRGGVEVFMCVCWGEFVCPDFMGWRQKLAMADYVPRGRGRGRWWGGDCGPILRILVRALLKKVSCVALNPFQLVSFIEYDFSCHLDVARMSDGAFDASSGGDGSFAIDLYFGGGWGKLGSKEDAYDFSFI